MPASKRDVIDATKEAVDAIDAQVVAAFELKNTSSVANSARMTDVINALNAQRTEIVLQDFKIAAGSRAMPAALDKIRAAPRK